MKNNVIKYLYKFNLLIFLLTIISCNNILDGTAIKDNGTQSEFIICGKICINGAVPQNLLQNNNTYKTAMPQISSVVQDYKIAATLLDANNNRTETISQKIYPSGTSDFSLSLPYGNWILEGYALNRNNEEILYGILGTKENPAIIVSSKNSVNSEINIFLSPISNNITGKSNLKIDTTGAGIKSVKIKWKESGSEKTQGFTNSNGTDLSSFYVTLSDDTDKNENKTAGAYEVEIIFYSEKDYKIPVFVCHEMINIFSNLTTDKWNPGSCSYITDNGFILTKNIINKRHYFYVNQSTGNDSNEGSSYLPLKSVQTAVDRIISMNDGDEYTIYLTENYNATGDESGVTSSTPSVVYINNSTNTTPLKLKIQSLGSNQYKIDSNNKSARVIYLYGKENAKVSLTLQNIKISGGKVERRGAGILAHQYTDLIISNNVTIENNTTTKDGSTDTPVSNYGGAGIYCFQGETVSGNKLTINGENVIIQNNTSAQYGGGIYINGCDNVFISNSVQIKENTAKEGGGIAFTGSNPDVEIGNIDFVNNSSTASSSNSIYLDENTKIKLKGQIKAESIKVKGAEQIIIGDSLANSNIPIFCDFSPLSETKLLAGSETLISSNYQYFSLLNSGYIINNSGNIIASDTSQIGSKSAPDTVGDIVFSDGSAESSSVSTLTQGQKDEAVGIVFTINYDSGTGGQTGGQEVPTMLMVGIRNSGEDGNGELKFCNNETIFYENTSDEDGSGNSTAIYNADNGNFPSNYPAYLWVNSYAVTYVSGEKYSSGWYIPAIYEMMELDTKKDIINNALNKINLNYKLKNGFMDIYWTSSQIKETSVLEYQKKMYTIQFSDGAVSEGDKNNGKYVLVIRKVE